MKTKTSELADIALDWAVAKCEEQPFPYVYEYDGPVEFTPSTNWSQGGPIIEREWLSIGPSIYREWWSMARGPAHRGESPLIAAMRCYVASKLGDEVEIPDELA